MGGGPRVPVYVLHWNAPDRAAATIASLAGSDGITPVITVVDNGSSATHLAELRATAAASVTALEENVGYAGAANAALAQFLLAAADDDWCVIAAHDALVRPSTLLRLIAAANDASGFGVLGPVHWARDFSKPTSIGGRWGLGGLRRASLVPVAESPHRDAIGVVPVLWTSGALLAVRAACARATGGFRGELFAYWEDVEFCLRAADCGWRTGVVLGAAAAESGFSSSQFAQGYYMARNHVLLARERFGPVRAGLVAVSVAAMAVQAGAGASLPWRPSGRRAASRAYARARWRGLRDGLRGKGGAAPCA